MTIKSWFLGPREEIRLRKFEITVSRRVFGLRTEEMTVNWRNVNNKYISNLHPIKYFSSYEIKKD
jgi:hypothetical protein